MNYVALFILLILFDFQSIVKLYLLIDNDFTGCCLDETVPSALFYNFSEKDAVCCGFVTQF